MLVLSSSFYIIKQVKWQMEIWTIYVNKKNAFYCNEIVEVIPYHNEIFVAINENKFMYNCIAKK